MNWLHARAQALIAVFLVFGQARRGNSRARHGRRATACTCRRSSFPHGRHFPHRSEIDTKTAVSAFFMRVLEEGQVDIPNCIESSPGRKSRGRAPHCPEFTDRQLAVDGGLVDVADRRSRRFNLAGDSVSRSSKAVDADAGEKRDLVAQNVSRPRGFRLCSQAACATDAPRKRPARL